MKLDIIKKNLEILIKIEPIHNRPTQVHELRGDFSKAKKNLIGSLELLLKN